MFHKRLSEERKKRKLRQQDMAKIIGVARTTYGMYEQGNRHPDYDTLQKIADYFNVTVDYLLGRSALPDMFVGPRGQLAFAISKQEKLTDHSRFADADADVYYNLIALSKRLEDGLKENNIEIDYVARECNVTTEYLQTLIDRPKKLPGVKTLYKLAELIGVTPDYLAGYTSDPAGHDPRTPRPKDMAEFLEKEEVMLFGHILDDEDKEKVNNILAAVFMDAKNRNKRK